MTHKFLNDEMLMMISWKKDTNTRKNRTDPLKFISINHEIHQNAINVKTRSILISFLHTIAFSVNKTS